MREIEETSPPGTMFAFNSQNAHITKELFLVWIIHFINSVKPSREKNSAFIAQTVNTF
jgi:hypothetical protein